MKRALEDGEAEASAKRWEADFPPQAAPAPLVVPPPGGSQRMGMKLLLEREEASVIQGQDGAGVKSLESLTGTRVRLSPEGSCYPGTSLRQLTILGGSCDAVLNAALLAISQLSAAGGADGEAGAEPEGPRLKVPVPWEVAQGLDEEAVAQLQLPRGAELRVLPAVLPPGEVTELSEQIVCVSGNLASVRGALQALAQLVSALASKSWFGRWAGHSHCGLAVPGLVLLEGAQAPAPRQLATRWDQGAPSPGDLVPGALAIPWGDGAPAAQGGLPPGAMALKLLLLAQEVAVLRGQDGAIASEIQQLTGTEFRFSPQGEVYPGTSLEELRLFGPSPLAAARGASDAVARVSGAGGSDGGQVLEPGAARARMVIPSKATSALIGPGGQVVARIRAESQMHVHVETTTIPLNGSIELSEQVVSFDGPLGGVQPALALVADVLGQFLAEPWFAAWAEASNSGHAVPGLALFQDVKGKGKSKGKFKGKDGSLWCNPGGLTMKLLLPPNEASCVLGKGGATVREIGQVTGTRMSLSNRDQFYPGTQLQELVIKGSTQEAVVNATMHTLDRIAELSGAVGGGEGRVEPGGCRLKVVVPCHSASAIIGPGGAFVKSMRESSRMHVHVEEMTIPPGPPNELTDQVVSLSGPLEGARSALGMLAEAVGHSAGEPWFEAWSANSHCGLALPGLVLFADGKGKAKGKFKGSEFADNQVALLVDGKGKGMMKGGFGGEGAWARPGPYRPPACWSKGKGGPPAKGGGGGAAGVTLKMLIAPEEVSALGADPATMSQIQQATGTMGMLSEKAYPGTALQELAIQGPSPDALLEAVLLILRKAAEALGAVRCGELAVPPGDARVKLVVPQRAAAAIIGPGGQNVKQLKAQAGLHVHVDANSIPCAPGLFEQGVCVAGPVANIQVALSQIVSELANCSMEPWFEAWASHSNAGQELPGLVLFEAKGKGGKGALAMGGGRPRAPMG